MRSKPVGLLKDAFKGSTFFLLGSGPSLDGIDLSLLERRKTIALNHVRLLLKPTFWLYGDPRFSRWQANKVAKSMSPDIGMVICSKDGIRFIDKKFNKGWNFDIYYFDNKTETKNRKGHWKDWGDRSFLPGRWTIATVALSFATLIGAKKVVLCGIDMSMSEEGDCYCSQLKSVRAPSKQRSMIGQWKKWMQYGFRENLWRVDLYTVSHRLVESCPWMPVKKISFEEALLL